MRASLLLREVLPFAASLAALIAATLLVDAGLSARELVALQSGGVSPFVFLRFVIVYGFIWAVLQLALAQGLGVEGDRISTQVWREEVKGNSTKESEMRGLWLS